jgi:hypothetical protein
MLYSGAFQLPAQAAPLGATSTTPGLLETKVKVGVMFEFELFTAVAVICMVAPTCREKLVLGAKVIVTG